MTECTREMSSDDDSDESGEEAAQNEPLQVLTDNKYTLFYYFVYMLAIRYKKL